MSYDHNDDSPGTNPTNNPHILDMLETPVTRRQTLVGGMSATTAAVFGGTGLLGLAGCATDNDTVSLNSQLGFEAIPKSNADVVSLPAGYTARVLWALGDSFASADPAWSDTGAETADSYNRRAGDHHDGLYYYGLNAAGTAADFGGAGGGNARGILAVNHEAPNPFSTSNGSNNLFVHPAGATFTVAGTGSSAIANRSGGTAGTPTDAVEQVRKEVNHHGVSVVEVSKNSSSVWSITKDSSFNRRVTGATLMEITGPLRGNAALITKFSTTATQVQGMVNNCAVGYTPWGTYLTCEENWVGYFARAAGDNAKRSNAAMNNINDTASLARYGSSEGGRQRLNWNTAGTTDEFQRWDTSVKGASLDGSDDFRNVINQYGYVVEIDPYNATAVPAKRTALGRFAHEGAWPAPAAAGKPLVWYMGDDNRGDYIYKFVSKENWVTTDGSNAAALATDRMALGAKYLDAGKLYVAKFNSNGTGSWILIGDTDSTDPNLRVQGFLNSRLRADAAGATRMDRPEWGAVNALTGEVYMTLTNNNAAGRLVSGTPTGNAALTDAANPRVYNDPRVNGAAQNGNPNGHVIRWLETGGDASALSFKWDIYLFGARANQAVNVNLSQLTDENDLSSPDGLWFGRPGNAATGLLWVQTDDGAYTDVTNCMMLAAVPGKVGDGFSTQLTSTSGTNSRTVTSFIGAPQTPATMRRFLVGPKECEITGVDSTPDGRTMFVSIQHPGEDTPASINAANSNASGYGSRWPGNQFAATHPGTRPRSAVIVITKNDGGVIGL